MATIPPAIAIQEPVSKSTKLRHLKLKSFGRIADILNVDNKWLEVAARIKGPDNVTGLFSPSDISQLQNQWKRGCSPAEAFLQHWSTTGMPSKHPTVGDLLALLIDAEMFHTANCISDELFKVPIISVQEPKTDEILASLKNVKLNNTAVVSNEPKDMFAVMKNATNVSNKETKVIFDDTGKDSNSCLVFQSLVEKQNASFLIKNTKQSCEKIGDIWNYSYEHLKSITKNFCDISSLHGGFKIGEGGFGTVYRAYVDGHWVAIKKLKNEIDKQFLTELEFLRRYKHENLLPLFGFSNNGPYSCLVYLYMENGSLQDRLICLGNSPPISWYARINIACGSARGINHLHTFELQPLVHRDIKSANVLLDKNLVPKVGDFGLARMGNSSTAAFTSNIFGTSVYMAPEAFHGEVSVKLDTFSYGVVLMELITGLPPYDAQREEKDLVSYLEEHSKQTEDIVHLLDRKAGKWKQSVAVSLYAISKLCVERRKKDRPTMTQILPDIEKLFKDCKNT